MLHCSKLIWPVLLEVLCDLGTDCSDCGPWKFQVPTPDHTIPKPVQLLREHRTTINVAQTATNPPFLMPYTSPEQDTDVSAQMHASRVVELGLTQVDAFCPLLANLSNQ